MKKFQRRSLLLAAAAIGAGTTMLSACGGSDDDEHPTKNIVELAQGLPQFSVLVEALVVADLVSTLSGAGPFTVFAPTNDAFTALLAELKTTKAALFADKALLTAVLKYHVLPSKVPASAVGAVLGKPIATVNGDIFKISAATAGGLEITDTSNRQVSIVSTDVLATNGVIHGINKVLLPGTQNIVQTAQSISDFSILVEAVVAADLATTLSGAGPFTVFAPTNAAFTAALTELGVSKSALLADKVLLTKILKYHVLPSRVLKAQVPVNSPITTLQGETFTVGTDLTITDQRARKAKITSTDVLTSNGVIHIIDKVILPMP
jgi:uncharacterized surface protein with fasciclin (FAS1) repeats